MSAPLHPTRNPIPIQIREQVIDIIQITLATVADLQSQTKQAHWNIKGPDFIALHKMFDKFSDQLIEIIDEIAESITRLGGTPMGTIRNAVINSLLSDFPTIPFTQINYLSALASKYSIFLDHLLISADRIGQIGDPTTQNYYLEIARDIEKILWFIEATLENNDQED